MDYFETVEKCDLLGLPCGACSSYLKYDSARAASPDLRISSFFYSLILVLFDIPEQARDGRHLLRDFLRQHGYTQLQKSAWYSMDDTYEQIQYFLTAIGVEKWVTIMRAQCPSLHRRHKTAPPQ